MSVCRGDITYVAATSRHRGMITVEQQDLLRTKRVAVAGAGGIGGPAALLCAKAGFGGITICDFDAYEVVNIVEQEFANYETVGRRKVEVAATEIRKHGHGCEVRELNRKIETTEDAMALMEGADYVFSAVDNGRAKILVDRAAQRVGVPIFLAANLGWTVLHLAYLPGQFRYEHIYERICPGLPGLAELSGEAVAFIELHHKVYFACVGGFSEAYLRGLLTGREDHLRYMAPQAYTAASLGVNELIKHATGRGPIVVAPRYFAFDTLSGTVADLESMGPPITAITHAAYRGNLDEACEVFRRAFPGRAGCRADGSPQVP